MDEKMEVEYEMLKGKLATARKECGEFEKQIPKAKLAKEIALGKAAELEMAAHNENDNNKKGQLLNEANNLRKQADNLQEEIKKMETALELMNDEVKELQTKINDKIAEVMKDPEVKKQLEEALKVRRERAAEKIKPLVEERDKKEKEKDELTKRKERLEKLSEAIKKNPQLKKQLEEYVKYRKELKDLKEELKTCKDDTRELAIRRRLEELNDKLEPASRQQLAAEVKKEKLELSVADIDGIVENGCIFEKDGSLNIDASLQKYDKDMVKTIKTRTMEINSLNKKIEPYKDILSKKKETAERSEGAGEQKEGAEGDSKAGEGEQPEVEEEKDEQPKWWQFRKRFQAWKEKRAAKKEQKALPEPEEEQEEQQQEGQQETPSNKSRKRLMESLIVKDAYDQMARSQGVETRTQAKRNQNQGR